LVKVRKISGKDPSNKKLSTKKQQGEIINEIKSKFPIFEKIKQNTRCAIRGHSFQVSESPNPSKTIHGYDHT